MTHDALGCIFSLLPLPKDIHSLLLTDKRFYQFISDHTLLWANLLPLHFPYSFPPNTDNPKEEYIKLKIRDKHIQKNQCRTHNLGTGNVLRFAMDGNKLCFANWNTIEVWDTQTGEKLYFLGNIGETKELALQGNVLCSSDGDEIAVWDLDTQTKRHTLTGHQETIDTLTMQNKNLVSSSNDSVMVWDLETGEELNVWTADRANINSHAVHKDTIFIAFQDNIKEFDIKTKKELHTWQKNSFSAINRLFIHGNDLVSCDKHGNLKVWDLEKREQRLAWDLGTTGNYHLTAIDNMLFSCGYTLNNNSIHICDLKTGEKLSSVKFEYDASNGLASHDGVLFTSGVNGNFQIYGHDFNFPSLSPYDHRMLEGNLSILAEMIDAEPEKVKILAQKLHPDFLEKLKQHAYKSSKSFKLTNKVILSVQIQVMFELLLDRIHSEDQKRVSELLDQLEKKLPNIDKLYQYLCEECGRDWTIDKSWGERAFRGVSIDEATIQEKEQAAQKFKLLENRCWGPDLPLLLVDFGIVSHSEYSQQLKCKPGDLAKVGIYSLADLQVLGLLRAPPLAHVKLSANPWKKREEANELLEKLSKEIQKRRQECDHFGVILFTDEKGTSIGQELSPWGLFQKQFEKTKALIEEICSIHQKLTKDNGDLLKKVNTLIDQFNATERGYQIAKLRAYISQPNIQAKWASIEDRSLSDYVEKHPQAKLFEMDGQAI